MRHGARVERPCVGHVGKRVLYTTLEMNGPQFKLPYVHEQCTCNEYVSLRNRVVMEVLPLTGSLTGPIRLAKAIGRTLQHLAVEPWTYEAAVAHMPAAKRARYLQHVGEIEDGGVGRMHATVRAFVKYERLPEWDKDPRMIQFRDGRYSLKLAQYLKPIEHGLYRLKGGFCGLPVGRLIAKGRNYWERAEDMKRKWDRFQRPVVISIDASRFDAHVKEEHLNLVEHEVYRTAWNDNFLAQLLSWQLVNKGKTAGGIKYKLRGGRMSGDMNTALGNCVLMVCFVGASLEGVEYDLYDDGDDCLIFCEQRDEQEVRDRVNASMTSWGFNIKFENRATKFEEIAFCQTHPIRVGERWLTVREPGKVLGFGVAGTKFLNNGDRSRDVYIRTLGVCGLATNPGVPLLQKYYWKLCSLTEGVPIRPGICEMFVGLSKQATAMTGKKVWDLVPEVREITGETRSSFESAFGYSVEEQLLIERNIDDLTVDSFGGVETDNRFIESFY